MQLVKAMVMGRQWDGATLALKTQQPVMSGSHYEKRFVVVLYPHL